MSESTEPEEDRLVYSVRPEPPQFDAVIKRPALYSNESPFKPPGPVLPWFGAHRLQALFRVGIVAALAAVVFLSLR